MRGGKRPVVLMESVLLFTLVVMHLWFQFLNFHMLIDDAYIFLAYSQSLAAGLGPVVNPGEVVEGYSSVTWMFVLAIPFLVGWDPVVFLKIVGLLLGGATVCTAWFYCTRILRMSPLFSFVGIALFAMNAEVARFFTFGLETPLFTLLILQVLWVSSAPGVRAVLLCVGIGGGLALTRPEGFLYFPAIVIAVFLSNLSEKGMEKAFRFAAGCAFGLAVVLLAIFSVRYAIYGHIFPNTYYAKITGAAGGRYMGLQAIAGIWLNLGLPAIILSIVSVALASRLAWKTALRLGVLVLTGFFFIWYSNYDWMGLYRFATPIYVILCILLAWAVQVSWQFLHRWLASRNNLRWILIRASVAFGIGSIFANASLRSTSPYLTSFTWKKDKRVAPLAGFPHPAKCAGFLARSKVLYNLKHWEFRESIYEAIVRNQMFATRPGYETVLPDMGLAAYASRNRIFDTKGLLNRSTAEVLHRWCPPNASIKQRAKVAEAHRTLQQDFLGRMPEIVMLNVRFDVSGKPVSPYLDAEALILGLPEFAMHYLSTELKSAGEGNRTRVIWRRSDVAPLLPEEIVSNFTHLCQKNRRFPELGEGLVEVLFKQKKNALAAEAVAGIYETIGPSRHFAYNQWARELACQSQPLVPVAGRGAALNWEDAIFWRGFPQKSGGFPEWYHIYFFGVNNATWQTRLHTGTYHLAVYLSGTPCQGVGPVLKLGVWQTRVPFPNSSFERGSLEAWEISGPRPPYQPVFHSCPFRSSNTIRFFRYGGAYWVANVGSARSGQPYAMLSPRFRLDESEIIIFRLGGSKSSQNGVELHRGDSVVARWTLPEDSDTLLLLKSKPLSAGEYQLRLRIDEPDKDLMFDDPLVGRQLLSDEVEAMETLQKRRTRAFLVQKETTALVEIGFWNDAATVNPVTRKFEDRNLDLRGLRIIKGK